ncbi:MAG: glycosyltransferase, partial [Desulfuromonadaceae bacterium]
MKIALNAILFLPGRIGGLEIYFRNLLTFLQRLDRDNRYALLCDRHYAGEFSPLSENFRIQHCNYSKPSPGWFFRGVIRNLCNIDILKPVMEQVEADLIHHPFSILSPLHGRIPTVLTFHDMQHEFFPEYFSAYEMRVRKEFYRASAERATRIMAISRYSRDCLVNRYGISPEKIDVVYLGYNAASYRVLDDAAELDRIRLKYRLDRPFLYYPAA